MREYALTAGSVYGSFQEEKTTLRDNAIRECNKKSSQQYIAKVRGSTQNCQVDCKTLAGRACLLFEVHSNLISVSLRKSQ